MFTRRDVLIAFLGGLISMQRPLAPHMELPPEPGEAECRNPTAFYWRIPIYGARCFQLGNVHAIAACIASVVAACYARWCL